MQSKHIKIVHLDIDTCMRVILYNQFTFALRHSHENQPNTTLIVLALPSSFKINVLLYEKTSA